MRTKAKVSIFPCLTCHLVLGCLVSPPSASLSISLLPVGSWEYVLSEQGSVADPGKHFSWEYSPLGSWVVNHSTSKPLHRTQVPSRTPRILQFPPGVLLFQQLALDYTMKCELRLCSSPSCTVQILSPFSLKSGRDDLSRSHSDPITTSSANCCFLPAKSSLFLSLGFETLVFT